MTTELSTEYIVQTEDGTVTVDVAADVGNSRTVILVRECGTDGVKIVGMPSARSLRGAFSHELFAQRGLASGSWNRLAVDEHVINVGGIERFVGRLAVDSATVAGTARGSDARYSDGWTLDFILAGVAAALPKAHTIVARVATGVPASLWASVAADVEKSLRGTHTYSYNGRKVTVKIESVNVRREGEAAYTTLPENKRGGKTLIIDGGGRTINLALFSEGEYRTGATIELGVEATLDDVDKALAGRGLRALTLSERIGLLDALRDNKPFHITVKHSPVRVDETARAYFDESAKALLHDLRARIPTIESAEHIYLLGGAAYFYGATIKAMLPTCNVITTDPELANVYGYLAAFGGTVKKAKRK